MRHQDFKIFINGEMWRTSFRHRRVQGAFVEQYEYRSHAGAGVGDQERYTNWINHRLHERKKCNLTVEYALGNRIFRDTITDLSLGGTFIETKHAFEHGQEIAILIQSSGRSIKKKGVVCRVINKGIGIAFNPTRQSKASQLS